MEHEREDTPMLDGASIDASQTASVNLPPTGLEPRAAPPAVAGDLPLPPPPPPPPLPLPQPGDTAKEPSADGTPGYWYPIPEDHSSPSADELAQITAAGEVSALDRSHWMGKLLMPDDPEYQLAEEGEIDWVINPFNGTLKNQRKEFVMTSAPVCIGGASWKLKLFPKGLDAPYLAVSLECELPDTATSSNDERSLDAGKIASEAAIRPQKPCLRVPAQFEVLVYNHYEPRVHYHKGSSKGFTANSLSLKFDPFAPVNLLDLGQRLRGQRQALVRNDTLALKAYIRVYRDPTGCLFQRMTESWDSLSLTGYRGLSDRNREKSQSFLAAVISWTLLAPIQNSLAKVRAGTKQHRKRMPLVDALNELVGDLTDPGNHEPVDVCKVQAAIEWHGARLREGDDIFEIWRMLKHLIESELSCTSWQGSVSRLFNPKGLRFKMHDANEQDPSSVQSSDSSPSHGEATTIHTLRGLSWLDSHNPHIIQIQLPRQYFDENERKWKKRENRVNLPELIFRNKQYELYGIVLHHGTRLTTRSHSVILRPTGEGWYKFGPDYEKVMRITTKQALQDTAHSSYVAIYVKRGPEPVRITMTPSCLPETSHLSTHRIVVAQGTADLRIIRSDSFDSYRKPGVLDCFNIPPQHILHLRVPVSHQLRDLHACIKELFVNSKPDTKCKIWPIGEKMLSRYQPQLDSVAKYKCVADLLKDYPNGYLWVHVLDNEPAAESVQPETQSLDALAYVAEYMQREDEELLAETIPPIPSIQPTNPIDQPDAIMAGTPEAIDRKETSTDDQANEDPIPWAIPFLHTYVLVKLFDVEKQTLTGLCSFIAHFEEDTLSTIQRKALSNTSISDWSLYEERTMCNSGDGIHQAILLLGTSTFRRDLPNNVSVVIIQPNLTKEKEEKVLDSGGILHPQDFIRYLCAGEFHPKKVATNDKVLTRDYFGSPYYRGTFSRGKPHGLCKEITLKGEAYTGEFRMGVRHGKGCTVFQNGDVYRGDWSEGKMHGSGEYVEACTGNRYAGEYRKGRKRGKGITEWQHAEEEVKVCRVCFENELNCAFYPCGHVCACLDCGKRIDVCPVCRTSNVKAFKLYFIH